MQNRTNLSLLRFSGYLCQLFTIAFVDSDILSKCLSAISRFDFGGR